MNKHKKNNITRIINIIAFCTVLVGMVIIKRHQQRISQQPIIHRNP